MNFSENLKKIRTKMKMSQSDLAKKVGVSERMIQKYEAGVAVPRITVADKIAKALKVSSDELVGGYRPRKGMDAETLDLSKKIKKNFLSDKVNEETMEESVKTIVRAYCEKTGAKTIKL